MRVEPGQLTAIFETAIAAQMVLFASVQFAGAAQVGTLRIVLGTLSGCIGLAFALNTLAALGIATGLRDVNIILELTCAAAIYLYVARAYDGAKPLHWHDLAHALPGILVFAAWELNLAKDLDRPIVAILTVYVAATIATAIKNRSRFRPKLISVFVALLTATLAAMLILRVLIAFEVQIGISMRDSGAYLSLMIMVLATSSAILFAELRHPNSLTSTSRNTKYAKQALSEPELRSVGERFYAMMESEKLFRDPEMSLPRLAKKLAIPDRELSQFVNVKYGMSVPALLNSSRVDEAARLLRDPASTLPITSIMYDSGFGSKSAFQREFLKKHGVSPSAYRDKNRATT